MEKKKMLIVCDSEMSYNTLSSEKFAPRFKKYEEYGYEISYIVDNSLLSTGLERSAAVLKVEKEGPEWCSYTPEVLEAISDADCAIMCYSAANSVYFDHAKKLKHLSVMRSGWENVNVEYANSKGVTVSVAPGRVGRSVADYAISAMLCFNRNFPDNNLAKRPGWHQPVPQRPMLVADMTIGFVGFGTIAKWVAERMSGFGCKFIAYDPFVPQEVADKWNCKIYANLPEMMAQADVVSVHARLLPSTRGIVNKEAIAAMKPNAIFINSARAGLIDEDALYEALAAHKIRGAVLDVFEEEPLSDGNRLRKLDNIMLTPHMAGGAGDMMSITVDIITEELDRYMKGEPLRNTVNANAY